MDAARRLRYMGQRGFTLVYVALAIVVLIALAGLAVDLGYMYVSKGQLQNAADSAALAGASKIKNRSTDLTQSEARSQAVEYALKNSAAQTPVVVANSGGNTLSSTNDIAVGFWNISTRSFTPNRTPVNAIQVRTRRTADSPGGQVGSFLARIVDRNAFDVQSDAIATLPLRASAYLSFCVDTCTTPINVMRIYETGSSAPNTASMFAWTTLLTNPTSAPPLNDILCADTPFVDVCKQSIYSSMGTVNVTFRNLESLMYDPTIDSGNKDITGNTVSGWWVIVPVTETCPPGAQGTNYDPKLVTKYAKVHIYAICSAGGGNACRSGNAPQNVCNKLKKDYGVSGNDFIAVDSIQCVDCGDLDTLITGLKPTLVE